MSSLFVILIPKRIEYIRVEFTRKKCKTAILLYCFHSAGVLHTFVLCNFLGPGTSFYRKVFLLNSLYNQRFLNLIFNSPIANTHVLSYLTTL